MSYRDYGHQTNFAGYPVIEWNPEMKDLQNPESSAFAIRLDWEDYDKGVHWTDLFKQFMESKGVEKIPAFIIGSWGFEMRAGIEPVIEIVASHRQKLPNLKALYVGDIVSEENEISWIQQGDLSPLLNAFPNLEHLITRGAEGLHFGKINMPKLKSLRIESGGLRREIVQSVGTATLPELEKLILWLGVENYGATTTIADLQPFYECKNMPKLTYLGLCDSEMSDEIATFIATAPVLERLETLDLSMGVISDDGALALLKSPNLRKLKHLNLSHNYFSEEMINKLKELEKSGMTVDTSDTQSEDEEWRFVAVSE